MGINVVNPIPLHFVEQHFRSFHLFISQKPWWNQRKRCGNVDCFCFNWNHQINSQVFTIVHGESQAKYTILSHHLWWQNPQGPHRHGLHAAADPHGREDGPPRAARGGGATAATRRTSGEQQLIHWWLWFVDQTWRKCWKSAVWMDMIGNVSINGDVTGK